MSPPTNEADTQPQVAPVSLSRARRLFERPDRVAGSQFLRREIAGRMFERLALIRTQPSLVIDAGCGEGGDLLGLQQAFPQAALIGIDASAAMLEQARRAGAQSLSGMQRLLGRLFARGSRSLHPASLACADFGRLPLASFGADLLWSNLALHWHPQPHQVIREWARVLRTDGLLMFSCFGPDTFVELRNALTIAGIDHGVLPFVDLHDYGDMMVAAGLATPVMDMEKLNITYSSIDSLLADVRAFGGNPLDQRRRGLTGAHRWQQMRDALDRHRRSDGQLQLTVEVVYGHAFRPQPRVNASGEAIIRLDLKRN